MHSLDLRTLLSLCATALFFGCTPVDVRDTGVPALPEGEEEEEEDLDEFADDDDATDDEVTGDDDEVTDDDDSQPAGDDDDGTDLCDDLFEDNDDFGSAAALGVGSWSALTLCDGDMDYYAIDLLAGDYVTVDVDFLNAEGDVDIRLLDASENTLTSSTSVGDGESIERAIATDGTYVLQVLLYGDNGDVGQSYDLAVEVGDAPEVPGPEPCPIDALEENDTDADASAVAIGETIDLTVCSDDEDWYAIDIAAGLELTVDLLFLDEEGDIDLKVVAPDGTTSTSGSVSDDESVTLTAVAGTYLVRAYLYADGGSLTGNDYDLVVTTN